MSTEHPTHVPNHALRILWKHPIFSYGDLVSSSLVIFPNFSWPARGVDGNGQTAQQNKRWWSSGHENKYENAVECDPGWCFQPLWKILVSWDDYSQYMEKLNIFQTTNQDLYVPKQTGQTRTSHQTWYWTWLNLSETKLANKSGIIKSNSKSAAGSPHWQAGDVSYHQTPTIPNTSEYCKSDATSRKPYAFFSDLIAAFNKLRHDGAIENPGVAAWIIQSSTNRNSAPVVDCPDDAAIQIGLNGNLGFTCQIHIYIYIIYI